MSTIKEDLNISKVWFTADTHFGHCNILQYCNRPFSSVEEMDAKLIDNWNAYIVPEDTVYHLGDFCMGDPDRYLSRLNGRLLIVPGSHDKALGNPRYKALLLAPLITISAGIKDEYGNDRKIVLCHYALRSWYNSHYATYALYGHHHGRLESYGLSLDVGVDTNNFYPYSIKDIERKMSFLKPIVDYRKKN